MSVDLPPKPLPQPETDASRQAGEAPGRAEASPSGITRRLYSRWFVPPALLAMTIAMFASVLFAPGNQVLSHPLLDGRTLFVFYRLFGFGQLRAGRIALWNPHVFSGIPFLGAFEPALFYPPNWIYLVLPLNWAMNLEVALHVFLLGLSMSLWVGRYRLHPLAVLLSSSIAMFGGAFFLHIYAGHLPHIDSMAWAPLILLSVDGMVDEPDVRWAMVGLFALAMQILAGYPQVFFDTAVACALYGAMRLVRAPRPLRTILGASAAGAGAVLITAVQLWTGLQAAGEGTRQGGVPLAFAGRFSFPLENFATLAIPGFFGRLNGLAYWGRWDLWEACLFLGLTGLTMALLALTGRFRNRGVWAAMVLLLLALAVGEYAPWFRLLYGYVPGFSRFRSPSKFIFQASLFMAMLSAWGMDGVLRRRRGARAAAGALLVAALLIGGFGAWLEFGAGRHGGAWRGLVGMIASTHESYVPSQRFSDPGFIAATRQAAGSQTLVSALVLLALAGLFRLRVRRTEAAWALAVFGIAEIFVFARSTVTSFPIAAIAPTEVERFLNAHPGDYRILDLAIATGIFGGNDAVGMGASDIWGYDPMVLRRYSQFITYSQGGRIGDADMYVIFRRTSRLLRLVRLRFIFEIKDGRLAVIETPGALPHLVLVGGWRQIENPDQILKTLDEETFDPQKTVILESAPDPIPEPGPPAGAASLLGSDANSLTISADLLRPAVLLITDTYSRYWRAVPLPGSSQSRYRVLPADYTLMAVPLGAGHHLFRLEYAPSGWVIGRWVSLAALGIYLVALGAFVMRRGVAKAGSLGAQ